jgi:hypothetical protein
LIKIHLSAPAFSSFGMASRTACLSMILRWPPNLVYLIGDGGRMQ